MAEKKTSKTVKKTTRGKPAVKTAAVKKAEAVKSRHMGEITAICAITAAILLGIGIYTDSGGAAGQLVTGVFKGLFGFGALLIPAATAWLGISVLMHRFELPESGKVFLTAGLFLCVITLAHVITRQEVVHESFPAYMAYAFKTGTGVNGGLFGALLGDLLLKIVGVAGTYIAVIALGLVLIILLTDKSIIQGVLLGINKAKSLRPERVHDGDYDEYDGYADEAAAAAEPAPAPVLRDPKKATVTIGERTGSEHPKILIFNEGTEKKNAPPAAAERSKGKKGKKVLTLDDSPASAPVSSLDEHGEGIDGDWEPFVYEPEITTLRRRGFEDGTEPPFDGYGYYPEAEEIYVDTSGKSDMELLNADASGKSDMELLREQLLGVKPEEENRRVSVGAEPVPKPELTPKPESKPELAPKPESRFTPEPGSEPLAYEFPPIELLNRQPAGSGNKGRAQILENSRKLEETLKSFGVEAKVVEVSKGPTVTRYELSPGQGVKVSKIAGLADDLALNLAAVGIRIEAPIPGKAAVGIEIPNKEVTTVFLREVIEDAAFKNYPSKLAFALGKDIAGNTVVADIARMPHLLIAGATGSGKSVCVNTLITSILYKADPNEVKLVLIDPKVVELSVYNGIPHLLIPVVTDPRKAAGALNWAVQEMINRYNLFAESSVRDLKGYNALTENPLPQIVIIIDELADLMMAAPGDVEDAICRLAQMARAAGLHLIIATQRPSVDVITGLIKANIPSRLAFAVSSGVDSRTVLDTVGAEKLLGKGDMLFYPVGVSKPQRVQGAFISDKEVENIVTFVKNNSTGVYDQEMISKITSAKSNSDTTGEVDELFIYAAEFVIEKDKASASMLQRQFRIGYNKAARIVEELETHGIVGPEDGSKPRKVLMNSYQWAEYKESL